MQNTLRLPSWVILWVGISTIVVIWDALFLLFRPASFPGQELGFLWDFAYALYMEVDHAYADQGNTYLHAVATMSLVEAALVGLALLAHRRHQDAGANLLVLVATSLTCAKTMLFILVEYFSSGASIAHNDFPSLLFLWIIPNGIWVVVPLWVIRDTVRRLLAHLRAS